MTARKTWLRLLSGILLAGLLTACGGGTTGGGAVAPSGAASDEAATGEAATGGETTPPGGEAAASGGEAAAPGGEAATIRLGGLTGPTTMGMVRLLKDAQEGTSRNHYDFTLAGSADELTPKLVQGELDIAAVPANLAAVLYNRTGGGIGLLAVNTLGVLYVVETGDTVTAAADLRGKTIYATGKGSTPEYVLRYILSANGLDPERDVTIEWKAEPAEVVALLSQGGGVAMLPQPFVTVAQGNLPNLRLALNLTQEWEALDNGSLLITGVLVARTDFARDNPVLVREFLDEYRASTEYINANLREGAQLVEEFGIVKAQVAEKAIPLCNIVYMEGEEMRQAASGYLRVLYEQKAEAVGGALPGDDFYLNLK
ncbi:MAG: ABC transporter substrate-binding protein [Peptococcaceae bacterium]|jgi:NitT/TauT family transport system substrate-binding protein|nr:ABC transporter substrate-binding protein [Peptococcaceae bacterium]